MRQRRIVELQPGGAGGVARAAQLGAEGMAELGASGGRTTLERHGYAHLGALARRAAAARWSKHFTEPRTAHLTFCGGDLVEVVRLVPYRPPRSRRKRPEFVRITLEVQECRD